MGTGLYGRWGVSWLLAVSGVVAASAGASGSPPGVAATPGGDTTRVSVSSTERQASDFSELPAMSAGGRYVVFHSFAEDLVPGDTNWAWDIFVRDRELGTTERVNVSSEGQQTKDELVASPAGYGISAGGRYVVFASSASNLVPHDTRQLWDVFIRDRRLGITRRVSVSGAERQANNASLYPAVSAGGRYVVFESAASNLVRGDTNRVEDVFVRDRRLGITRRVSVSRGDRQANAASGKPAVSGGGRYVVFESSASNLVPGDTNGRVDVFVRDRKLGITRRVSVSGAERQANGSSSEASLSADGRFVVFGSEASNLVPGDTNGRVDVFMRDRRLGITRRVSVSSSEQQGNRDSFGASAISVDGHYVVFASGARNLVPGDTNGADDVFVRDRRLGITRRVSVSSSAQQGNSSSVEPAISADGLFVAFASGATNLVPNDTNDCTDVFVRDNGAATPGLAWWLASRS